MRIQGKETSTSFYNPFLYFIFLLVPLFAFSQISLNGYVKDASSGETLIGATVSVLGNPDVGALTNSYGFYSISLPEGEHKIVCAYLGYKDLIKEVSMLESRSVDFELTEGVQMEEVVISDTQEKENDNVDKTQMGVVDVPLAELSKMPALLGEVDILKVLQLLPGVLSSEGSAGFYVRGGGPDQNLILLDEAVVYNSGHLLGFFSVFNADAIKNTTLIKGGAPANYGGRLSSVVDISMKDGNDKHFMAEGGIGLISSRLTLQGPIIKEKCSFLISGRRTYALDIAQPFIKKTEFAGTNYYFYDLNTKINYKISNKDRLYFSSYFGRDVLAFRQDVREFRFDLPYGNKTATFRWNHLWSDRLFFNVSAIYNDYIFGLSGKQDAFLFDLSSGIRDFSIKTDFDYFYSNRHRFKFGINAIHHKLTPSTATASDGNSVFEGGFEPKYAYENSIYFLDDIKVSGALSINLGARYSAFTQVGPATEIKENEEVNYGALDPLVTYHGLEPRATFKYSFHDQLSIKGGLTMANQYLHLVSNSTSTLPTDIWVPSTKRVKPQRGIQYALGLFRNYKSKGLETSLEVYYRDLSNQIDYAEDYVNDLSSEEEDEFVFGKGRAYGMELFVKKSKGRWNGWIGYTLSKGERSFDDIEDGRWFPNVHDKTHDVSIVSNFKWKDNWDLNGIFVYGTGKNYTPFEGFYFIENDILPFYGPRNSQRLDAYHRIDVSLTWTPGSKKKDKRFVSSWTLSFYNIYNRKNPFFTYFDTEEKQDVFIDIDAYKVTIFPIIPSISWNFKWNQK